MSREIAVNLINLYLIVVYCVQQLLVTSPDGQPLSGEDVRITAKSGAKTFYNKQFVVKNGVVDFEVKDTPLESNHISIDVSI